MPFVRQCEKNTVELGRPQMTIWCMHIWSWIPQSTDKHLEYVTLIAVPLQQWLHERTSVLICTLSVCLYVLLNISQLKFVQWNRLCHGSGFTPQRF